MEWFPSWVKKQSSNEYNNMPPLSLAKCTVRENSLHKIILTSDTNCKFEEIPEPPPGWIICQDSQSHWKSLIFIVMISYSWRIWIKISQVNKHIGQGPGEATNAELPVVLFPWSEDSVTLPASMCDNMQSFASQKSSSKPWCPEFLLGFAGISDCPHDCTQSSAPLEIHQYQSHHPKSHHWSSGWPTPILNHRLSVTEGPQANKDTPIWHDIPWA